MATPAGYAKVLAQGLGGRRTLGERSECPPGMSPDCSDIVFGVDSVRSRPGLGLRYTCPSGIQSFSSFYGMDRVRRLVALKNNGELILETPEGQSVVLRRGLSPGMHMKAAYAFNRYWMCFSDGQRPLDYPWQFDPQATDSVENAAAGVEPGRLSSVSPSEPIIGLANATAGAGGSMTAGVHYFFFTDEDRYGYITQPSGVGKITVTGGQKITVTNALIQPATVNSIGGTIARRRVWCSVAEAANEGISIDGVGSFFNTPALTFSNASTTLVIDGADSELLTGVPWDPAATQVQARPALGVFAFNNRLGYWGVYGGIPNVTSIVITPGGGTGAAAGHLGPPSYDFANYGQGVAVASPIFDSGWHVAAAGGQSVNGKNAYSTASLEGVRSGICARFKGDNANAGPVLSSTWPAYKPSASGDNLMWARPGVRVGWLIRMRRLTDWGAGVPLEFTFTTSALGPALASRTFAVADVSTDWAVYEIDGALDVPDGLGSTDTFTVSLGSSGVTANAEFLDVDWMLPFRQDAKFDGSTLWLSEFGQPEQFDLLKSPLPVNPGDGTEIRAVFQQTSNLYIVKERSLWVTSDNEQDPSSWNVDNVSPIVGTPSSNGVGLGPDFAIICARDGAYYFDSGKLEKVSLEIQPDWDGIDWEQAHLLWCVVDPRRKRVEIGIPLASAVGICSKILVLDYVEGWGDGEANGGHGRKWTVHTVETLAAEYALKDNTTERLTYGGRRTSSNSAIGDFTSVDWIQQGIVPYSGGGPYVGPLGSLGNMDAVTWAYSGTGVCRATYTPGLSDPLVTGEYFVASFWARTNGGTLSATIRDPFVLADVPITIRPTWQRFVARFGPNPRPPSSTFPATMVIDIDFGSIVSSTRTVVLAGPQLQHGPYDRGYVANGVGLESGFLSSPNDALGGTPGWAPADWDNVISPVYETAPFGLDLGRSQMDNLVARIRGEGGLSTFFVDPDGVATALDKGTPKTLESNPKNDVNMGGYAEGTFIGLRLTMSSLTSWFTLKRLGTFTKPHETTEHRGR